MCIFLSKKKLKLPEFMYNILAIILGSLESIEEVLKFFKPRKKDPYGSLYFASYALLEAPLIL